MNNYDKDIGVLEAAREEVYLELKRAINNVSSAKKTMEEDESNKKDAVDSVKKARNNCARRNKDLQTAKYICKMSIRFFEKSEKTLADYESKLEEVCDAISVVRANKEMFI